MMLFDQLRLKAAIPVTRGIEIKLTILGFEGLAAIAIAAVPGIRGLMFAIAQMIIQLGIERRLDRNLGQHLAKVVQITFGFDGFGGLTGEGFQFFLVHN